MSNTKSRSSVAQEATGGQEREERQEVAPCLKHLSLDGLGDFLAALRSRLEGSYSLKHLEQPKGSTQLRGLARVGAQLFAGPASDLLSV